MKFDPHLLRLAIIAAAFVFRMWARGARKKARSAPQKIALPQPQPRQTAPQPTTPASAPVQAPMPAPTSAPRPKAKDDSPWTSGGNPFDS